MCSPAPTHGLQYFGCNAATTFVYRVDGICGSGQNGTVKKWGCGKCRSGHIGTMWQGGQCGRNNTVTKAAYKISSLEVENDSLYI